jgi:hypothetical protein
LKSLLHIVHDMETAKYRIAVERRRRAAKLTAAKRDHNPNFEIVVLHDSDIFLCPLIRNAVWSVTALTAWYPAKGREEEVEQREEKSGLQREGASIDVLVESVFGLYG